MVVCTVQQHAKKSGTTCGVGEFAREEGVGGGRDGGGGSTWYLFGYCT